MSKKSAAVFSTVFVAIIAVWFLLWAFHTAYSPSSPEAISNTESTDNKEPKKNDNIILFEPKDGDEFDKEILVKGEARVFENIVDLKVRGPNGGIVYQSFTYAQSPDVGQFGAFEKLITYFIRKPSGDNLFVDVYWSSPRDGSDADLITVPVRWTGGEMRKVQVFYSNARRDLEFTCTNVFSVERYLPASIENIGTKTLEILLDGMLTEEEVKDGFSNSLNLGVTLQNLTIENGVARADFDETLETQVGGACRVAAIRSQITETLKQFPAVQSVLISVNGRIEDILQP